MVLFFSFQYDLGLDVLLQLNKHIMYHFSLLYMTFK